MILAMWFFFSSFTFMAIIGEQFFISLNRSLVQFKWKNWKTPMETMESTYSLLLNLALGHDYVKGILSVSFK